MASNTTTASTDPLASFPRIPVDNTLGAWFLGVVGSILLNGLIFHQTYRYFKLYPEDRMFLKVWVVIVGVAETFVSALTIHTAYFYLITKYWDPTYFFVAKTVWSLNILPIAGPIAAILSQLFFARRVWLISRKFRIIVVVSVALYLTNCGCFTALSVKMFKSTSIAAWLEFSWLASVGSSLQMAGDILLTSTLIYVLQTSRTGINKTNSMLDLLITYTISTGLISCIVHILNVAFSIAYPNNFIYAALSCILTKLYANSFLVALNTRRSMNIIGGSTQPSSGLRNRGGNTGPLNMPIPSVLSQPTAIELKVVTEVTTVMEEEERRHENKHIPRHGNNRSHLDMA